ncbi:VTT domain-containing protein [Latilactobacillus curvatus]|nr:VTT domain-containing protein [Latilactobacillus curvatus]
MQHPALGVLIGYAVPMIPTAFVNLAAGDTHLTPRAQGLACFGGSTIVAFIYAFAGDLLILKQDWKSLLILLIVAVVIGLTEYGIRMRRSDKARQKVEQFDALN